MRTTINLDDELIERAQAQLMGRGINYVDAHLIASTALTAEATLWTRDKRLHDIAAQLDLAF